MSKSCLSNIIENNDLKIDNLLENIVMPSNDVIPPKAADEITSYCNPDRNEVTVSWTADSGPEATQLFCNMVGCHLNASMHETWGDALLKIGSIIKDTKGNVNLILLDGNTHIREWADNGHTVYFMYFMYLCI